MPTPLRVYVSFAPKDEGFCEQLEKHLAKLTKAGRIDIQHRGHVLAGQDEWAQRLSWLMHAHIIVELCSSDYEHDDGCTREATLASERQGQGTRVVPVLVRKYDRHATRTFEASQVVLPRNRVAITSWPVQDEAWTEVAAELRAIIEEREQRRPMAPSMPMISPLEAPGPKAREPSKLRAYALVAAAASLLVGSFVLYRQISAADAPSATIPLPAIQGAAPPTKPRTSIPTGVSLLACGAPCCGGSSCVADAQNHQKYSTVDPTLCAQIGAPCGQCQSGRACVAMSCGEQLPREATYNLRLAHAVVNGADPSFAALVCFKPRAASSWTACVPYSSAAANANNPAATAPQPVPVKVGDMLTGNGLDVAIFEGQLRVAQYTFFEKNIKAAALCAGLRISPTIGDQNAYVLAYLDDP